MSSEPGRSQWSLAELRQQTGQLWRWFRSMRTAIGLMVLVVIGCVIGSVVPQGNQSLQMSEGEQQFYLQHPLLAQIAAALGFFNVFQSWWFILLVILLVVSLSSCLSLRWRGWLRMLGVAMNRDHRGKRPHWIQVAGKLGSLCFHTGLLLVVAGAVWGSLAGMNGNMAVIPGSTWYDTPANFTYLHAGPLYQAIYGYPRYGLHIRSFRVSYYRNLIPRSYTTRLQVLNAGKVVRTDSLQVNHPLHYEGVSLYQNSYGWAPQIEVRAPDGQLLSNGPVIMLGTSEFIQQGVLKLPEAGPPGHQLGLALTIVPDYRSTTKGPVFPSETASHPLLAVTAFEGDLQLNRPQNTYSMNVGRMHRIWSGTVTPGHPQILPGGYQLAMPAVHQYSVIEVNFDPGFPLVLAAFVLMGLGLVTRFYLPLIQAPSVLRAGLPERAPRSGIQASRWAR